MIISIKSERDFYVPTVFGDLMNHWRFQIATEARLKVRCCLGKTYIVQRVAIWTTRLSEICSLKLGKARQKRIKATILVRSQCACQLELVSSWCESRLAYFAAKLTSKGRKISVPSYKRYTDRSWILQSRESLGKDTSCRKLYRDDIPQYGCIRREKVHPWNKCIYQKSGEDNNTSRTRWWV